MQSIILGALGCAWSLVPSVVAPNLPHAIPELLVVPNNLTIMTPRDTNSMLQHQMFDFGSPFSNGFSGLRHLAARQEGCDPSTEVCPDDPTTCCEIGGDCCGGGNCCQAGSFCYGGGCCLSTRVGCDNQGCCDPDAECCTGGGCCASGSQCVTVNGELGCCPIGDTCTTEPQCTRAGYTPCPDEDFCCPTGFVCTHDSTNEPLCEDPNTQTVTITSVTTRQIVTATSVVATSVVVVTSHAQSSTLVSPGSSVLSIIGATVPTLTHIQTTERTQKPQPTESGAVPAQSQSTTNIGAIAGGTAAGVVVIVIILVVLIIWRRGQPNRAADSKDPTGNPAHGPPKKHAYSPDTASPTSGTINPFLTPMTQQLNPVVPYFTAPVERPTSGFGTSERPTSGAGTSVHYTGLPELHGNDMGVAVGMTTTPVPRPDIHPNPLPMNVTPLRPLPMSVGPPREPASDSGSTRVWSGFVPSPSPSGRQSAVHAGGSTPTPSGWPTHEIANDNSVYSNTPTPGNAYASTPAPRAPSTSYQPPIVDTESNEKQEMYSPPVSPPPESLYPRAFSRNNRDLPGGAAPVTGEKSQY